MITNLLKYYKRPMQGMYAIKNLPTYLVESSNWVEKEIGYVIVMIRC
jgi:hypothetical protein